MEHDATYAPNISSAAARSTRAEIESSSYQTTPSHTPPNERNRATLPPYMTAADSRCPGPPKVKVHASSEDKSHKKPTRGGCYLQALHQQRAKDCKLASQSSGFYAALNGNDVLSSGTWGTGRPWSWNYQDFKHKLQSDWLDTCYANRH